MEVSLKEEDTEGKIEEIWQVSEKMRNVKEEKKEAEE